MPSGTVIGVFPPAERGYRSRLFEALEAAFPVRFEGRREGNWENLDALIMIDRLSENLSVKDINCFAVLNKNRDNDLEPGLIEFTNASELDSRLRSRALHECKAHGLPPIPIGPGDKELAFSSGYPVWTRRHTKQCISYFVSLAPSELSMKETLRDHLCAGRFFDLLPLIHFLREVTSAEAWTPPPLRATFIFDDPNLHFGSYGFINFQQLAEHAKEHNYHVAMATIPLDARYASPRVSGIFQKNDKWLSLLIHGNDHIRGELGKDHSEISVSRSLARALLRIADFERRTGLSVSRIMVPPHGQCSELAMRQMLRLGFDAICISRPYPWLEHPPDEIPLAQWWPTDIVAGLPVISRYNINNQWDDIVIRAFLDQPIVLYGHHWDISRGMEILADVAKLINSFGDVRWMSLGRIVESSFSTQKEGNLLRVRLLSRRIELEIHEGVERVLIEKSPEWEGNSQDIVYCDGFRSRMTTTPTDSYACNSVRGSKRLEVTLPPFGAVDPNSVANSYRRIWPTIRRIMTESRDRILPLKAKVSSFVQ